MPYIVWSRRCRKCKGQFYLEESEDGKYLTCIQCGHSEKIVDQELVTLISAIQPAVKREVTREPVKELSRV
jgi:hypothetical protein